MIAFAGRSHRKRVGPWTLAELNQILGSARTMPGDVSGIPGRRWWPALLLVTLDSHCHPEDVLSADQSVYDRSRGTITVGMFALRLHARTVEALEATRGHGDDHLLPWPYDGGRKPFHILLRRYKHLLYRAGLPYTRGNLFNRLMRTAAWTPDVVDCVNLDLPFTPVAGQPHLPRARDRRRWNRDRRKPGGVADPRIGNADGAGSVKASEIVIVASNQEWTLSRFFEEVYKPRRLEPRGASSKSAEQHRVCIRKLCAFAGCDVTLAQLSDDLVEGFLAWLVRAGRTPSTVNGRLACILAQWRYAWRKRLVDELPRDVEKLPEPKRLPKAWTVEEMGKILSAATETEGEVCGIGAGLFWVGVVLTFYDTGLRRSALLGLRSEHVNTSQGVLFVPAEVQKQSADGVFGLGDETCAVIAATRPHEREMLFPWPYSGRDLTDHFRAILKRAGLPHGSRDLFHKIRRTSGTYVREAAGERAAQEHLGHSGPAVTRRYIDPRLLTRTNAAAILPRPAFDLSTIIPGGAA